MSQRIVEVLLLDYIQRIRPPGERGDRRASVDATMDILRQFADAGDGLNLASYRGSSELEFGADDAFILVPDGQSELVTLRHLKARHSEAADVLPRFDRRRQRFESVSRAGAPVPGAGELTAALAVLWDRTPVAASDAGDTDG